MSVYQQLQGGPPQLGISTHPRLTDKLVQMGGREPGLVREPGKIKHLDLTGMDDGHAETSEGGVE
jgi:hypothetical protein